MKFPPDRDTWIISRFIRSFPSLWLVAFLVLPVTAQILQGAQVFTNGLAIVDSPAPNSVLNAGQSISLAIDVSGNGHMSVAAQTPGSGQATSFGGLEVYLTSYVTGINFTISSGPELLLQEPGSTVKHVKTLIPNCLPAGPYNLTLYEVSSLQGTPYFGITFIPVQVNNAIPTGICLPQINSLQSFPQASNPMPYNPFVLALPTTPIITTPTSTPTAYTTSSMTTVYTSAPSGYITITLTSGESILPQPTNPPPASATTVTVVYVSVSTVTTVINGQTTTYASADHVGTRTELLQPTRIAGFVPVNAAPRQCIPWLASLVCAFIVGQFM